MHSYTRGSLRYCATFTSSQTIYYGWALNTASPALSSARREQAVEKRVATVGRLKKEVEIKLQQVTQEVMDVTTTKHRLEESVALKGPPLQITWQRYRARSQRPERELVHDEVSGHSWPSCRASAASSCALGRSVVMFRWCSSLSAAHDCLRLSSGGTRLKGTVRGTARQPGKHETTAFARDRAPRRGLEDTSRSGHERSRQNRDHRDGPALLRHG